MNHRNQKNKSALITGGAGFIGSHLAEALLSEGYDVRIMDNFSTGKRSNISHIHERLSLFEGDIQDPETVRCAVQGCDVVFHLAALVSVTESVEKPVESALINEIGTIRVLDASRQSGVRRVVIAGSSAVYGDDPQSPKHEGMTPKPQSPYAVQKLTKELYARLYYQLYGLETVCLRFFNVFGPRQDPSSSYSGVISIFMNRALLEIPPKIFGDGDQFRDFIFVKDVIKYLKTVAVKEGVEGQVFNVGTGSYITINQLWTKICHIAGKDLIPKYEKERPGDIRESLADISFAKQIIGIAPEYSLDRGLEITYQWYKEHYGNSL